jgi:hypothetical protein
MFLLAIGFEVVNFPNDFLLRFQRLVQGEQASRQQELFFYFDALAQPVIGIDLALQQSKQSV